MSELRDDPVYKSSRREAAVALSAWCACGVYSLTYCYLNGYDRPIEELRTAWGIPHWVLFGVFLPWLAANVFAWWFCFRFIRDCDLGGPEDRRTGSGPEPPARGSVEPHVESSEPFSG